MDNYPPIEYDWYSRAIETNNLLVPWLVGTASGLKDYVEQVVNAGLSVRHLWSEIKSNYADVIAAQDIESLDKQLCYESFLLVDIRGDLISKVIEKYLIDNFVLGELESNGSSDYPDLFLRSKNYSGLPKFVKTSGKYGAALKGPSRRSVRVPDGLEIKTCRDRFSVDAHYPHPGLHLALLFHKCTQKIVVDDVKVAFLCRADYRITQPKTGATTLKASFNGEKFVSLLTGK